MWYFTGYENSSPENLVYSIPFFAAGVTLYVIVFFLFLYIRGKKSLFVNKIVYVIVCIIASFCLIMPLAIFGSQVARVCTLTEDVYYCADVVFEQPSWNEALVLAAKFAVGSFAFQWPSEITSLIKPGDWAIILFCSVVNFFFLSYMVVEAAWHGGIKGFLLRNFFHRKNQYLLFTDLPYDEIKDFLSGLKRDKSRAITWVVAREDMFVEDVTFLRDQISALDIHTQTALIDKQYFRGQLRGLSQKHRLTIYVFNENDRDNLAIAELIRQAFEEEAPDQDDVRRRYRNRLEEIEKLQKQYENASNAEGEQIKKQIAALEKLQKRDMKQLDRFDGFHTYVSYQRPTIVSGYGRSQSCDGHVHFFSEYESIAEKFVFEHPVTSLMKEEALRDYQAIAASDGVAPKGIKLNEGAQVKPFEDILREVGPVHIDFLGFGNVNQAMFRNMASSFQLPGTAASYFEKGKTRYAVSYKAYSRGGENGTVPEVESLLSSMGPLKERAFDLVNLEGLGVDLNEDSGFSRIADDLESTLGEPHYLIVSLGDSQANMEAAIEVRHRLYQKITASVAKNPDYHCNMRIYVYVRETTMFDNLVKDKTQFIYKAEEQEALLLKREGISPAIIPIFIFGREGRFWNEQDSGLIQLATGYFLAYDSNRAEPRGMHLITADKLAEIEGKIENEAELHRIREQFNQATGDFYIDKPHDQDANYDAAIAFRSKLALLGYEFITNKKYLASWPASPNVRPALYHRDEEYDQDSLDYRMTPEEEDKIFERVYFKNKTKTGEMLALTEHNRWAVHESINGFLSLNDEEMKSLNAGLIGGESARCAEANGVRLPGHTCIRHNEDMLEMERTLHALRRDNALAKDEEEKANGTFTQEKQAERLASYRQGLDYDYRLAYLNDVRPFDYLLTLLPHVGWEQGDSFIPSFVITPWSD